MDMVIHVDDENISLKISPKKPDESQTHHDDEVSAGVGFAICSVCMERANGDRETALAAVDMLCESAREFINNEGLTKKVERVDGDGTNDQV